MSLILIPTIQHFIVHMHTKFHDSTFISSWERCDTKFLNKSYGIAESQLYRQTRPTISKQGYKIYDV